MLLEWGFDAKAIAEVVEKLMEIRRSALRRHHSILSSSAKAYFKFLKLGASVRIQSNFISCIFYPHAYPMPS